MAGIVEQLELDTSSALRSISDVERALVTAASSFSSAVSEAIDTASEKPVALEGDATAVKTSIDEAVVSADTLVVVDETDAALVTTSIEEATASADTLVVVEDADSSAVTSSIEDATASADTSVTIDDVEAGAIGASIESEIASADTTVVIEADASGLVAEIESAAESAAQGLTETIEQGLSDIDTSGLDGLTGALGKAETGSEGLANQLSGLGVVTTAATGGTRNLGVAIGAIGGPAGLAAATAVTGLVIGISKLSGEAEEAYLAQQRFNATFGETARIIEQIDVGGLNISLSDLAVSLGSDDDAIRQVASDLGLLASAAGATDIQTAEFVKTVIALSAQIVATNPALGSMEDILPRVALGLSGNARAGRSLGLSFTEAQITAEALAKSGGKAANQLTFYDKAAAGARLRSRELGNTISTDVNKALDDSIIKLRAANAELGEARENLGEKLRGPFTATKTFFTQFAADLVGITAFAAEGVGIWTDLLTGDFEGMADSLFGTKLSADQTATALRSVGLGIDLQPAITSFAELELAATNAPEILTAADRALLDFAANAIAQLPTVSQAFEAAATASKTALDGLVATLPTVSTVFDEFAGKSSISIKSLTLALDQQVIDQGKFFTNIQTIIAKGGVDVAQQYLDMGPVEGAALAQATARASESRVGALEKATDAAIATNEAGQARYNAAAQAGLVEGTRLKLDQEVASQAKFYADVQLVIDKGGLAVARKLLEQGPEQGKALAAAAAVASVDQVKALDASTINAEVALQKGADSLKSLAFAAHKGVGAQIAAGMAEGINDNVNKVETAARRAVRKAAAAAAAEAESKSPSKLFAREVGRPIGEGIALGINQTSSLVAKSAVMVVQGALVAAAPSSSGPTTTSSNTPAAATPAAQTIVIPVQIGNKTVETIVVNALTGAVSSRRPT